MTHLKWYALLALIILVVYATAIIRIDGELIQDHEASVNEQQALQTQLSAQGIEAHFQWVLGSIANLGTRGIPNNVKHTQTPPEAEHDLVMLLGFAAQTAYPEEKLILRYVDRDGNPIATYTRDDTITEDDFAQLTAWIDTYGAEVSASGSYVVTPLEISQHSSVYGIIYPVGSEEIIGMLAVMLDFNTMLDQYVHPICTGSYSTVWIEDSTSRVIYGHEPTGTGVTITDLAKTYPDLGRVNTRMMTEERGQDQYHYTREPNSEVQRRLVAWSTAYLGDQRLTVVVAASDSEINADVKAYRQTTNLVGILLAITLVIGSGVFYTSRQRDLKRLVDQRTAELQELNSALEQRVNARTVELTQKNAQLSTILETIEDGVVFRREASVLFTNSAITRLLGYTQEEIQHDSRRVFDRVRQNINEPTLTKLKHSIAHALQHGNVHREDLKLARKDGEVLFASLYVAGIYDDSGTQIGTLEIVHDNSHAMALQQQKDRFITNASHELRRPLSNLKTRLYLLRQQPEQLTKHLEVLERATNDMTDLVRDLVDVAQFTRDVIQLNRQNITIQAILDAARALQEIIAKRKDVQLDYNIIAEPLTISGDYQRLSQALSNVVIHTINTTTPGSTISLQLTHEVGKVAHWGIIRVVDENCNLEEDDLQEIFNPFYRPSEGSIQSTGLGLTIAHLIIEQHGGALDVHNHPSGGIVFVIRLPLLLQEHTETT